MARDDVLLINLPASGGREQSGRRPAIAVQTDLSGEPMLIGCARFIEFKCRAICLYRKNFSNKRKRFKFRINRYGFSNEGD